MGSVAYLPLYVVAAALRERCLPPSFSSVLPLLSPLLPHSYPSHTPFPLPPAFSFRPSLPPLLLPPPSLPSFRRYCALPPPPCFPFAPPSSACRVLPPFSRIPASLLPRSRSAQGSPTQFPFPGGRAAGPRWPQSTHLPNPRDRRFQRPNAARVQIHNVPHLRDPVVADFTVAGSDAARRQVALGLGI